MVEFVIVAMPLSKEVSRDAAAPYFRPRLFPTSRRSLRVYSLPRRGAQIFGVLPPVTSILLPADPSFQCAAEHATSRLSARLPHRFVRYARNACLRSFSRSELHSPPTGAATLKKRFPHETGGAFPMSGRTHPGSAPHLWIDCPTSERRA